jgi:hypothetical protein
MTLIVFLHGQQVRQIPLGPFRHTIRLSPTRYRQRQPEPEPCSAGPITRYTMMCFCRIRSCSGTSAPGKLYPGELRRFRWRSTSLQVRRSWHGSSCTSPLRHAYSPVSWSASSSRGRCEPRSTAGTVRYARKSTCVLAFSVRWIYSADIFCSPVRSPPRHWPCHAKSIPAASDEGFSTQQNVPLPVHHAPCSFPPAFFSDGANTWGGRSRSRPPRVGGCLYKTPSPPSFA